MRIPYEDRKDRYTVEWEKVGSPQKSFDFATITIHELWGIGHLTFDTPLKVEVFFGDNAQEDVLAVYDFGMEDRIAVAKEHNFLYDYAGDNKEADPIKTVFATIKFDLMHAFFHYKGDPNYSHTHWALYGNLFDIADADDSFIVEDWEYEEEQKKQK